MSALAQSSITLAPRARKTSAWFASGTTSMPSCSINVALPMARVLTLTTPLIPIPDAESNCSALSNFSSRSLLGETVRWPNARAIDRLAFGSLLFGVSWGLAGFCPGPGLVALGMGESEALVFTAAMLTGMIVFEGIERRKSLRAEPAI